MGFFRKKHKEPEIPSTVLTAPVSGQSIPLSEVPDPAFADGLLGKGLAIIPASNVLCSPCNGVIDLMFDTGHAVNIISDSGIEILIHIGLETVSLKGRHFTTLKATGDRVARGEPLIEFEREAIEAEGFNMAIPIVICNSDLFFRVAPVAAASVQAGEKIITVIK